MSFLSVNLNAQDNAGDNPEAPIEPSTPAEWFGEGVRPTDARTPEEERNGFHLPQGFEIDLIAAEPQIAKPLNMAFDAQGRIWLTQSTEYPFPAKEGEGHDEVKVLEDRDGNGSFESVRTFADGLNIPIGILPYGDGVICFSIPNLLWLRDTDGDGKCDRRDKILGPFDTTRDTHGMVNSLHRGLDGWIYACHGFNNNSTVAGTDGHQVSMSSGNTFRFRLDGSRVEHFTLGQVNPFGMAEDKWGNLFTADCHSKPITQLIRGGCYESFGKPHDGLGFVPPVMEHLHGSTAICGLAISWNSPFPKAFEENFFSGNVMTSRINRNRIERHGASVRAVEKPDFLTSDDPWFRPVDLQFGPDGALYVADFYNKIIGHYEVPLKHPGRDRFRGRIWRIRYVGSENAETAKSALSLNSLSECIAALGHPNPLIQRLALNAIEDRYAKEAIEELHEIAQTEKANPAQLANAMWALVRIDGTLPPAWTNLARSEDAWLCNQAMMAASVASFPVKKGVQIPNAFESPKTKKAASATDPLHAGIVQTLPALLIRHVMSVDSAQKDFSIARRSAVEAISRHGSSIDVGTLLKIIESEEATDPVLAQSAKIACRDLLRNKKIREEVLSGWAIGNKKAFVPVDSPLAHRLIPILLTLKSDLPVEPILAYLARQQSQGTVSPELLSNIAVSLPLERTQDALKILAKTHSENPAEHVRMILEIAVGQLARLGKVSPAIANSASQLNKALLEELVKDSNNASAFPLHSWLESRPGSDSAEPWPIRSRNIADKEAPQNLYDSIQLGEKYIGKMTATFTAPATFSFVLAGHNGQPDGPDNGRNYVQIVNLANNETLYRVSPPRNDIAMRVQWDLSAVAGKTVRLECVDADDQNAYAWIAVGDFSLPGLSPSPQSESIANIMKLNRLLSATESRAFAQPLIDAKYLDASWRFALASSLESNRNPFTSDLLTFARDRGWAQQLSLEAAFATAISESVTDGKSDEAELLKSIARRCDGTQQRTLIRTLSKRLSRLDLLTQAMEQSWLGRDALATLDEAWWNSLPNSDIATKLKSLKPTDASVAEQAAAAEARANVVVALPSSVDRGLEVFKQRCALCHKLDGQGTVLGPQLEGVGGRGLRRLAEDVLLPNRNVDEAFRMSSVLLDSGTVLTGLIRQRTDAVLVIADQLGKESTVELSEVEEEKRSDLSLMPGNFGEVLSDQDLADLLSYLQSSAKKP